MQSLLLFVIVINIRWFYWSHSTLRKVFYVNQLKNDLCNMPYHITGTKVPGGGVGGDRNQYCHQLTMETAALARNVDPFCHLPAQRELILRCA